MAIAFSHGLAHEDAFPPHRPNAGYVIGKETVAWARGSARDAPKADVDQGSWRGL